MDPSTSAWAVWIALAIASGVLEIKLSNVVFIWFGVGALVAAALAGMGLPLSVGLAAFTLVSVTLFALSRTLFKSVLARNTPGHATGVDALIGAEATVIEALTDSAGVVRIHGERWSARSLEGPLPEGARVLVERVEGLKLWVRKARAPVWGLAARSRTADEPHEVERKKDVP